MKVNINIEDNREKYDIIIGHFKHLKQGILKENNNKICSFGERIEKELEKLFLKRGK
ncbi:hypothetical protein Mgra_00008125 [Meloidogyne graminicola]|uniref:Uncharacterized protein n=1 Tax=Meloidogyne graminicola TaxID=189291 RepID=A0A8S9ZGS2_9BILA|nr:hypothetical protein Mgra_00008125 [Meloidogyne graminicola]